MQGKQAASVGKPKAVPKPAAGKKGKKGVKGKRPNTKRKRAAKATSSKAAAKWLPCLMCARAPQDHVFVALSGVCASHILVHWIPIILV